VLRCGAFWKYALKVINNMVIIIFHCSWWMVILNARIVLTKNIITVCFHKQHGVPSKSLLD
jgi:hypothetical protein